jgi:hypothetical protein
MVADQLAGVFVAGDDEDIEPALLRAADQGGDDVVGLHPRLDQDGDPEPLEHPADHIDLRDEVGRHLAPVRLVRRIDVRAEDRPRAVEGRGQVVGPAALEQVEHVAENHEDGLRRLPGRPGHFGDRVKHLEDQRIGIQNVETRPFLGRARSLIDPRGR